MTSRAGCVAGRGQCSNLFSSQAWGPMGSGFPAPRTRGRGGRRGLLREAVAHAKGGHSSCSGIGEVPRGRSFPWEAGVGRADGEQGAGRLGRASRAPHEHWRVFV